MPLSEFQRRTNPAWLGPALCMDDLPWDQALDTTMPDFLARYTLHDSFWRGLVLHPRRVGVLCLLWDAYWTQGRMPDFDGLGPFLFVRFVLHTVDLGFTSGILAGARSEPAGEERHRTLFASDPPEAELRHEPGVRVLCLDLEKRVIPIPLDPADRLTSEKAE